MSSHENGKSGSARNIDAARPETSSKDASGLVAKLKAFVPNGLMATLSGETRLASTEEERDAYIHEVRHEIAGWNGTGALRLVHEIGRHQIATGVRGDVAEIGVHHGQLLIFLMMMLRNEEQAVAIDLFEEQHLNIDASGKGDRETMTGNVERYVPKLASRLTVIAGDSTRLKPGELRGPRRSQVRLFSVDGGHTRDVVINDLFLAADALHDAGVVVLDDVFNAYFPGVGEGLSAYVNGGADVSRFKSYANLERRLIPFAIGCNKVLLAFEPHHRKYAQMLMKSPLAPCIKGKAIGWGNDDIPVFEM